MPYIGRGLHFIVALLSDSRIADETNDVLAVHYSSFPLLSSVAYFVVEYLPELRFNRTARSAAHAVTKFINPDVELRDAQRAFEQTATVGYRIRLAQALLVVAAPDDAEVAFPHAVVSGNGLNHSFVMANGAETKAATRMLHAFFSK